MVSSASSAARPSQDRAPSTPSATPTSTSSPPSRSPRDLRTPHGKHSLPPHLWRHRFSPRSGASLPLPPGRAGRHSSGVPHGFFALTTRDAVDLGELAGVEVEPL